MYYHSFVESVNQMTAQFETFKILLGESFAVLAKKKNAFETRNRDTE